MENVRVGSGSGRVPRPAGARRQPHPSSSRGSLRACITTINAIDDRLSWLRVDELETPNSP